METMPAEIVRLCDICTSLIPRNAAQQTQRIAIGTLDTVASRAVQCQLCELIASAREYYLWGFSGSYPDADEASILSNQLKVSATACQKSARGLAWTLLDVSLAFGLRAYGQDFFLMACDSNASCANDPIWMAFPTGHGKKMEVLRGWYQDCQSNHPNCQPKRNILPQRLVQIPSAREPHPRLVYSNELGSESVSYACLSYCWGALLPIRTLKENESAFRRQIPHESLPTTFKDAIAIAQTLGISYIWIDALCIVQDDPLDWEKASSIMDKIYAGASITFAAGGAKDPSEGFFAHETPRSTAYDVATKERTLLRIADPVTDSVTLLQILAHGIGRPGKAPFLQTRGWTLQENVLSRRVVQCLQSEMAWRCNTVCRTESGLVLEPFEKSFWNLSATDLATVDEPDRIWREWAEDYSHRKITYPKDRLPALIGLVNHYQSATGDQPCLGMWKGSFPRDLAWRRAFRLSSEESERGELDYPSWSWLSCPHAVSFVPEPYLGVERSDVRNHVTVVDLQISWKGLPLTSKLESARLVIDGPVRDLFIQVAPGGGEFNPPYCNLNRETRDVSEQFGESSQLMCYVQFDHEDSRPGANYTCLHLLTCRRILGTQDGRIDVFLLLEAANSTSEEPAFRRVGLGALRGDEQTFEATPRQTIRLL